MEQFDTKAGEPETLTSHNQGARLRDELLTNEVLSPHTRTHGGPWQLKGWFVSTNIRMNMIFSQHILYVQGRTWV